MALLGGALLGLLGLEILGRALYPLDREARSRREARRDHRRELSCLGSGDDAERIIRDLYLLEKRYLPFLGWAAAPDVRLATIETNAAGFRDRAITPRAPGEYRILLTGGSFAWGLGASCNAMTVAGQLETLLNARDPGRGYRVMNGAFMNWTVRHERVVVMECFDLFDPDMVISLSGYNDLVALAKGIGIEAAPEAALLTRAVAEQVNPVGTTKALRKLAGTLGVWRLSVLLRERRHTGPSRRTCYQYEPSAAPRRIARLADSYLAIADYLGRKACRYLVALEPEIYSSGKALTAEEFDLRALFLERDEGLSSSLVRYRGDLSRCLSALQDGQFRFVDLARVFDDEDAPVFIDYNHVCDAGNRLVAEALAEQVGGSAPERGTQARRLARTSSKWRTMNKRWPSPGK